MLKTATLLTLILMLAFTRLLQVSLLYSRTDAGATGARAVFTWSQIRIKIVWLRNTGFKN
jgi:hypothetical protein